MRRNDARVAAAGTKKTMVIPVASSNCENRRDIDVVYRADDAVAPTTGNVELSSRWHQQQSTGSRAPVADDDDVAAVDTTAASAATVPSIFDFAFSMIPRGEELRTDHTDSADALHSFFYGGLPRSQAEGERMSDRTQVDIKERTVVNLS